MSAGLLSRQFASAPYFKCVVSILFLFGFLIGPALAAIESAKRVALVIGNGAYVNVAALSNPVRDAKLIAETLRKAGFEVIEGTDLDKAAMTSLLDQFTEAAFGADLAVVFYAGHGIQVDGRNYLFPINAKLENVAQLKSRTVSVDAFLSALPADPAVGIIILDACRDNPLARTLATSRSASVGAGLAPVQANSQNQGAGGMLIAYATDPGSVAYDGKGEHSPYSTALAHYIATPGLEIQSALTRVRAEVSEATKGAQRPWHNASLAREVFIGGAAPVVEGNTPTAEAPTTDEDVDWTVEQALWEEASKRDTIPHYQLYLQRYPKGKFADVARLNITVLEQPPRPPRVDPPVPPAEATVEPMVPAPLAKSAPAAATIVPEPASIDEPGSETSEASLQLSQADRVEIQRRLRQGSFYAGTADGEWGPRTRKAIGEWQTANGFTASTYLNAIQKRILLAATKPTGEAINPSPPRDNPVRKPKLEKGEPAKKVPAKQAALSPQPPAPRKAPNKKMSCYYYYPGFRGPTLQREYVNSCKIAAPPRACKCISG